MPNRLFPAQTQHDKDHQNNDAENDYVRNHILPEEMEQSGREWDLSTPMDRGAVIIDQLKPTIDELDNIAYTKYEIAYLDGLIDGIRGNSDISGLVILDWLEKNDWVVDEPHPLLQKIIREMGND